MIAWLALILSLSKGDVGPGATSQDSGSVSSRLPASFSPVSK